MSSNILCQSPTPTLLSPTEPPAGLTDGPHASPPFSTAPSNQSASRQSWITHTLCFPSVPPRPDTLFRLCATYHMRAHNLSPPQPIPAGLHADHKILLSLKYSPFSPTLQHQFRHTIQKSKYQQEERKEKAGGCTTGYSARVSRLVSTQAVTSPSQRESAPLTVYCVFPLVSLPLHPGVFISSPVPSWFSPAFQLAFSKPDCLGSSARQLCDCRSLLSIAYPSHPSLFAHPHYLPLTDFMTVQRQIFSSSL